jgi:hypothetical protein
MTDQVIAEIARRLARSAANTAYERSMETKKEYTATLMELCAAVKAEQHEKEAQ